MNQRVDWLPLLLCTGTISIGIKLIARHLRRISENNQKIETINRTSKQLKKSGLQKYKKQASKRYQIAFDNIRPTLNESTLIISKKEINIDHQFYHKSFNNISGGSFQFNYGSIIFGTKNKIHCEINDATIFRSILKEETHPIKIFHQTQPRYKSFKAVLNKKLSLGVFGLISYNLESKKFNFEPFAIGRNLAEIISSYQDQKIQSYVAIFFVSLLAAISIAFTSAKFVKLYKIIEKRIGTFIYPKRMEEANHENYLKNLKISADPTHQMMCYTCIKKIADLIFQCGHLVSCEACQLRRVGLRQVIRCPVCHKVSEKFTKIFIA